MSREKDVDISMIQQAMFINALIVVSLTIVGVGTWYLGTHLGYFLAILHATLVTMIVRLLWHYDWNALFAVLWPFWGGLPVLVYIIALLKEQQGRVHQREQALVKEIEHRRRIEHLWHHILSSQQACFWITDTTTGETTIHSSTAPSELEQLIQRISTLPADHPFMRAYQDAQAGKPAHLLLYLEGRAWACTLEPEYHDNTVQRILGLAVPQSEHQAPDETLEEEYQLIQCLVNASPIIFFRREREVNGEWHLVYISPNIERILGYSEQEVLDSDLQWALDITHPDDLPKGQAHVARLRQTGSSTMRIRLRHKNGHYVWIESHAHITQTMNGREVYQGYMLDITELATTKNQIEEQKVFYHTILEQIPGIVLVILADGTILYASANAPRQLPGLQTQTSSSVPASLMLALAAEDRYQVHQLLAVLPTLTPGEVHRTEWVLHTTDGSRCWYEVEARHPESSTIIDGYIISLHDVTERKTLANRLELFLYAVEHGAHPMLILDEHLRIVHINSAFQRLFDKNMSTSTSHEFESIEHVVAHYQFDISLTEIRRHVLAQGQWQGQLTGRHQDGRPLVLDVSVSMFKRGGHTWFFVIVQDITEKEQLTQQLQQANLFLEQLIEHSPIVMFRREGADLRLTYISPNVERILGFSTDAMLGKPIDAIMERVPPEELPRLRTHAQRVLEHGYDSLVYRAYHRDGSLRWIYGVSRRFTNEDGTHFVVGYLQDITEQEEARQALLQSESRYRQLIDQSGLVMCILDMEGYFLWANRTFEETTGYTIDELRSKTLYDFLEPETPYDIARFLHTLHQDGYAEGIGRARHKDGSRRLFKYRTFLRLEDGEAYIYAYGQDITEQYHASKAQKRLKALQQTLWKLGKTALQERSPEALYTFTVTTLAKALHAPYVLLLTYTPHAERTIQIAAAHGLDSEQQARLLAHGPTMKQIVEVLFTHTPRTLTHKTLFLLDEATPHFAYCLPLTHEDTAYGVLMVGANEDIFDESTTQFLQNVSTLLVNAFHRYAYEHEIETLAYTDPLTHLPNRRLFLEEGNRLLALAQRHQRSAALLYLDLDQFKEVNDTLSHEAGDLLLREMAHRLREATRSSDLVARLGGDEFAALFYDIERDDALRVAYRIQEAFQEPVDIFGHRMALSTSIGIALFPEHGTDLMDLLRKADIAMYHAKRTHAFMTFYDENLQMHQPEHLTMAVDLRTAIQKRQIEVYFQPILDLKRGTVPKVEALARWFHPEHGFISPGVFIPLAEEHGLITELDHIILEKSAQYLKAWHRAGHPHLGVAINLSPQTIRNTQIVSFLKTILSVYNLPPGSITIEMTESIFADHHVIKPILQQLQTLGIEIAIDDFGTGYSSLAYIENLPLNIIKADRGFVMGIGQRPTSEAILRTILILCHNLGIDSLAEGVETRQQLQWLRKHKCRFAQGFLLSKPVPPDEILARIISIEENIAYLLSETPSIGEGQE